MSEQQQESTAPADVDEPIPDAEPQTRDFVDRSLRELLSKPVNLHDLIADAAPNLIAGFNFEKMQPARREYFLGNWRSREADLLFEIPYRVADNDTWVLVCVLLEHQTKADWRTPLITLIYAALYWEWQLRQWEQQKPPRDKFQLRPILPIVLHTGPRPWGAAKSLGDLITEPAEFLKFLPEWKLVFWELANHSTDELLHSRDALLQVLALLRVENEDFAEAERVFRETMLQMGSLHDSNYVRWQDLIKFTLGWACHRRPVRERSNWQHLAEELQADEQRKREARTMGMTIADAIRKEGKAEGIVEGKAAGILEGKLGVLIRQGRRKWGEPDSATLQAIQTVADGDRLDRMGEALVDVKSWAELLTVQ